MYYMIANALLAVLPPTRFFAFKRFVLRLLGLSIGDKASVCGAVKFYGGGRVFIGQRTWVGIGTQFHTAVGADVVIGDDCDIAPAVLFACGSHQLGDHRRRAGPGYSLSIRIGSGTWIGARTTILGGADVQDACVIGAGSLVLGKRFAASTMLYGAPAKAMRTLPQNDSDAL